MLVGSVGSVCKSAMVADMVTRIVLGVEYNGREFCGWQTQPQGGSVQQALERALTRVAGHPVITVTAGRTDSGVHAIGQVVHFDSHSTRPMTAWVRGTNSFLPLSMAVRWAHGVDETFHARYSAQSRSYRYILHCHPARPGLEHGRIGWYHGNLDIASMQRAAQALQGEHDFSAFRAAECQARSPVRHLQYAQVRQAGEQVIFEFTANAFLHHMVRNLVGSLLWIGQARRSEVWLSELLHVRQRSQAGPTAAAAGLYLCHVEYAAVWGLPNGTFCWTGEYSDARV